MDAFIVMPDHVHAILVIDGEHKYSPSASSNSVSRREFASPAAGSMSAIVRS
ncbi:MAG: hypothetical protein AB7O65_00685 [Candidatus Korobacteraceae bacterium]